MPPLLPLLWLWGLGLGWALPQPTSSPPTEPLPSGWQTAAPPPSQTFAAAFQYHSFSSCSQSWSDYRVTAAVTLALGADGAAQACREHRADNHNPDGTYIFADLQSMSGRYTRDGDWIDLTLAPDGTDRCGEPRSTYAALRPWHLRCTWATPPPGARGSGPRRRGRLGGPRGPGGGGRGSGDLLPGEWLPLGAAPGLLLLQDFDPDGAFGGRLQPAQVSLTPLSQPPSIGARVEGLIFPPRPDTAPAP